MDTDRRSAARPSQLKIIVVLFVVLRVTILFLYTPQGLLNAYTDYHHYFRTAQLSDQGYWPFVNMWSEYPPLLTYTTQAVYGLAHSIVPMEGVTGFGYQIFARLLAGVLLLFETGALILIHRIGTKAWGLEKADWLAWVYSSLSLPLFFWNASQTSNITFFTLLAIFWFIDQRYSRSAAALMLGVLIKFTPIFLLGPVVRYLWPRRREIIRYAAIMAVVSVLVFAPFFLVSPDSGTAFTYCSPCDHVLTVCE